MDKGSKSPGVAALMGQLRQDLGQDYFVEVPHWNGDRTAIGLGRPDDPRFLIYLSMQPGSHDVYMECEIPPDDDAADVPYEVTASGNYTDYEQILDIVRTHLAR
jgi:hypothetical protein